MSFGAAARFEARDGWGFGAHFLCNLRLRQTGAVACLEQHIQKGKLFSLGIVGRFDVRLFQHLLDKFFMGLHGF